MNTFRLCIGLCHSHAANMLHVGRANALGGSLGSLDMDAQTMQLAKNTLCCMLELQPACFQSARHHVHHVDFQYANG